MLLRQIGTEKIIELANKHAEKHGRDGKIKELEKLIMRMPFWEIVKILQSVPKMEKADCIAQLMNDEFCSVKNGKLGALLELVKGDLRAERIIEEGILADCRGRSDWTGENIVWAGRHLTEPRVETLAKELVDCGFPRHMAEFAEAQPSAMKILEDGAVKFDPETWDMGYGKQMAEFSKVKGANKERIQRRVENVSQINKGSHQGCITEYVVEMGNELYDFESAMRIFYPSDSWQIRLMVDQLQECPTYDETSFASVFMDNIENNRQILDKFKNLDIQKLKKITIDRGAWQYIVNLAQFLSENYPQEDLRDLEKEVCKFGPGEIISYVRCVKNADCRFLLEEFMKQEPNVCDIAHMMRVLKRPIESADEIIKAIIKSNHSYAIGQIWNMEGADKLALCKLAGETCDFDMLEDMIAWEGADREILYHAMKEKGTKAQIEKYDRINHVGKEGVRTPEKLEDLDEMLKYVR